FLLGRGQMNPTIGREKRKVNPRRTELHAASSLTALIAVCVALTALASNARAAADSPSVSGPIAGTPTISEFQDLAQVGYEQAEFFLSGMAHSYSRRVH